MDFSDGDHARACLNPRALQRRYGREILAEFAGNQEFWNHLEPPDLLEEPGVKDVAFMLARRDGADGQGQLLFHGSSNGFSSPPFDFSETVCAYVDVELGVPRAARSSEAEGGIRSALRGRGVPYLKVLDRYLIECYPGKIVSKTVWLHLL